MPDNFGRMTSDEAPQSLKDFCFPKQIQNEKSTQMQDQEFRRNCELRAMDEPVSNRQALEALDHIVKNPQRDAEDTRTLNQAVSALENFIYIHQDRSKIAEGYYYESDH